MEEELFGTIARMKQYVTEQDVCKALNVQKKLNEQGQHKLIGLIMLEEGMLNSSQLLDILKEIEQAKSFKYY